MYKKIAYIFFFSVHALWGSGDPKIPSFARGLPNTWQQDPKIRGGLPLFSNVMVAVPNESALLKEQAIRDLSLAIKNNDFDRVAAILGWLTQERTFAGKQGFIPPPNFDELIMYPLLTSSGVDMLRKILEYKDLIYGFDSLIKQLFIKACGLLNSNNFDANIVQILIDAGACECSVVDRIGMQPNQVSLDNVPLSLLELLKQNLDIKNVRYNTLERQGSLAKCSTINRDRTCLSTLNNLISQKIKRQEDLASYLGADPLRESKQPVEDVLRNLLGLK